jgi:hypothetical protein
MEKKPLGDVPMLAVLALIVAMAGGDGLAYSLLSG